jgi:RNA polymerase sigma-70 factor (family 1)
MKPLLNETELISLVANGDRGAFTRLYTTYLNNIYKYIFSICYSKEVSEEIVQQLFVKIWENRANLTGVIAIKPYLYRSAKNLLLNHIKKEQVETRVLDVVELNTQHETNNTYNELVYGEYYQLAQNAINLLPEKRRQIFKLRLNDDLSLDEIALKLSISKSVVKKQLYTGMDFVRKYLFKHGEIIVLLAYLSVFGK